MERFRYDPYGAFTVLDPNWSVDDNGLSDVNWVYLHQGGRYDGISGLYHFRHREFSSSLGRWVQQDPLGYVDGMSLYQAFRSNPVNERDPSGLRPYYDPETGIWYPPEDPPDPGPGYDPETSGPGASYTLPAWEGPVVTCAEVVEVVCDLATGGLKTILKSGGRAICKRILKCSVDNAAEKAAKEAAEKAAQMKKLSPGEIKKLKEHEIDPHDLKPNSKYDLFKDKDGNIYVKPKDGCRPGDPTGINVDEL